MRFTNKIASAQFFYQWLCGSIRLKYAMSAKSKYADFNSRRRQWRRSLSGLPASAKRRRLRTLLRGVQSSNEPVLKIAAIDDEFAVADPLSLKIVLIPRSSVVEASDAPARASNSRKQMRRLFYEMSNKAHAPTFELISSQRSLGSGRSRVGLQTLQGRVLARGIFLETLGAAIVPGLSASAVDRLEASGAIVLENGLITLDVPLSDPASDRSFWHLEDINHRAAIDKNLTGKGVLIGVLDTGIDGDHPAFNGKAIFFGAFSANGDRLTVSKTRDFGDHGTHVCGLCAGNGMGVAPNASLAVAAVLTTRTPDGKSQGTLSQILAGLNWLASGGKGLPRPVDMVNASLGAPSRDAKYYQLLDGYRAAGLQIISSIGNEGRKGIGHHTAPASFDRVLAVGASDQNGHVATFSAWGPGFSHPLPCATFKPDFLAPGVGLTSCVPRGRYQLMSGTSMAAPLATGVAALLMEKDPSLRSEPDRLSAALLQCLRPSASQPTGTHPQRLGAGNLDLAGI